MPIARFPSLYSFWITRATPFLVRPLALGGICIPAIAFVLVLCSYLYWVVSDVRGPSLVYFFLALTIGLVSKTAATRCVIFFLPLIPTLHEQVALVFPPRVQFFFSYPGIDVIAGFCSAMLLVQIQDSHKTKIKPSSFNWPIGLLLVILSISSCLAIFRNLHHAQVDFSSASLLMAILQFKIIDRHNVYYPIVDWIVYSMAGLLIQFLIPIFTQSQQKDDLLFKPLIFSLIISACLGVFQSLTSIGLPHVIVVYRPEDFGFGAQGFQPDIHSFAGLMLIGTLGLSGYWQNSPLKTRYLIGFAAVLCWIALYLSKSRASLLIGIVMMVAMVLIHQWKLRKHTTQKKFNPYIVIGTLIIISLTIFSSRAWLGQTFDGLAKVDLADFDTLNLLSRWRLEFFRAALLMFEVFPLMGVGQGNLFHLSADITLGKSVLMAHHGGGDAHNYFLQTLAETGLIGVAAFTCVFIWPYLQINTRRLLIPCTMAIIAVFLGNIYSHSLIIRDNLFLLATMISLLYAHAAAIPKTVGAIEGGHGSCYKSLRVLVYICVFFLLAFFCIKEVTGSFSTPFFAPRLDRP